MFFCPEVYRLQDQRNVDPRVRLSSVPLPVRWWTHRRGDCELCWRCGSQLMPFQWGRPCLWISASRVWAWSSASSLPGLRMFKVSLKKDGHYFCTHVSQATVEAAGPEQLQEAEGGGNSDVAARLSVCSAPGNVWASLCTFLACRHGQTEERLLHGAAGQRCPPVLQCLRSDGKTHRCVVTHSTKSYFVPAESKTSRTSPDCLAWYFSQATGSKSWFLCDVHARLRPNRACWSRIPTFIGMNSSGPSLFKHRVWSGQTKMLANCRSPPRSEHFANVMSACHCRRAESGRYSTAWMWRCQVGCCYSFCRRTHQVGVTSSCDSGVKGPVCKLYFYIKSSDIFYMGKC